MCYFFIRDGRPAVMAVTLRSDSRAGEGRNQERAPAFALARNVTWKVRNLQRYLLQVVGSGISGSDVDPA